MMDARHVTLRDGQRAQLRAASGGDAPDLAELDRALIADGRGVVQSAEQAKTADEHAWRIDQMYAAWSADSAVLIAVAELDGRVVASAELKPLPPARCAHVGVLSVGVHPAHQRLGLGRLLMEVLLEHARARELVRLELYVMANNERAQALYESLGFAREGTRRRFIRFEDGRYVDDHIYALFLDEAR